MSAAGACVTLLARPLRSHRWTVGRASVVAEQRVKDLVVGIAPCCCSGVLPFSPRLQVFLCNDQVHSTVASLSCLMLQAGQGTANISPLVAGGRILSINTTRVGSVPTHLVSSLVH